MRKWTIIRVNPDEKLGKGIMLIEEGEYRCRACNNLIAVYRRFENK
jgi:hypothetical protein